MNLRNIILFLLLLTLTYFTLNYPSFVIKPFYYIKDILFSSVHALSSNTNLSEDVNDSIINNLKQDILKLEKLNNINLSLSDFEMINATVISRNRDYWFNTLTINKGMADGINTDMAVIDCNGLIGRISMVTNNTATVKLITTNDTKNKVSAVIHTKDGDIYGIINGYDYINNFLQLIITDNKEIEKDSKVETTGMGGVFPSGILIGKVYDAIKKEDGVTNIIRIIPSSNIEGERYVTVLQRKEVLIN